MYTIFNYMYHSTGNTVLFVILCNVGFTSFTYTVRDPVQDITPLLESKIRLTR